MELYRIAQELYADDLSGNGARIYGGRWNNIGSFAVYTSFSRSLALLETLAHTPAKMLQVKIYLLLTLSVPDAILPEEMDRNRLISGWDAPDTGPLTRRIGDRFLQSKSALLLSVPSVLMPEENNYLLNPLHSDMKKVKLVHKRRMYFDSRVSVHL
jgi:RES domain-containing protein